MRADAAVHHVRRRDDVGAGGRVRQRGAHQLLDGRVVGDLVVDDDAAVAVDGVLAQADVGDDEQVRDLALDRADRALHRRLRIVGRRSDVVLVIRAGRTAARRDAVGLRRRRLLAPPRPPTAGTRRASTPTSRRCAFALADEQRLDEHVGRQPRLAHERAHRGVRRSRRGRRRRSAPWRVERASRVRSRMGPGVMSSCARAAAEVFDERVDEIAESCSAPA